jgi:hypothetical protein
MRKIGYILLVVGFVWLVAWCAGSVRPMIRHIGIEHFKSYPDTKTYSGTEVCDAIRSALLEYQEYAHGVVLPATLMLAGGVLLDVAGRRNAKRSNDKPSA